MATKRILQRVALAATLLWAGSVAAAVGGPTVLTMPDGKTTADTDTTYAWVTDIAGNPPNPNSVYFWGRVIWDGSTTGNYTLDCGNGATTSGAVANADDIGMICQYVAAGTYFAKLTVTDGNGLSDSSETRIDVKTVRDMAAQINWAIERGLKYMYDRYLAFSKSGLITRTSCSYNSCNAQTASAVLAFENRGHTPALDEDGDNDIDADDRAMLETQEIYAQLVHKALEYVQARLRTLSIGAQTACDYPGHNAVSVNPDVNGNNIGYSDNDSPSYDGYTLSQLIMGFVGSGKPDGNPATLDATDIPAWAGPAAGRTFKEMVQDLVEYYYYGQVEDSRGVYCGGWRYSANYSSSDNSPAQWPALSIDEAVVQWGIPLPSWVPTANNNWTDYSQYWNPGNAAHGRFGYTSSGGGTTMAMTGAGLAQLFMQDRAPGDPNVDAALQWMACNWYVNQDMYVNYGVTKSMRMARDPLNPTQRETLNTLTCAATGTSHDWNDEYNAYLVSNQQADGSWTLWNSGWIYSTAWAVEILTPALTGQPPVANAGGPYATPPNQPVPLDGCMSTHENASRSLVLYEWDLDSDGIYDVSNPAPVCTETAPPFPNTGSDYTASVVLRVTDDVGDTDTDSAVINITNANISPTAHPGGPYFGSVNQVITLDAGMSSDPNAGEPTCGDIVKYEWDLDGNGSYETNGGMNPTYDHSWSAPYNGQIGLRVTDDCNAVGTSQTQADIAISDLQVLAYADVSLARVGRALWEVTAKVSLINQGNGEATNVAMNLFQAPNNVTVTDADLSFNDFSGGASGETQMSTDTFTIVVNRVVLTQTINLSWRLTYDGGAAGSQDLVIPFTPLAP